MAFKYDFETALVRKGHDSYAEDHAPQPKEGFDYIPMAVADMGFIVCPSIVEKIKGRLEHPIFGYYGASPETEEWWNCVIDWQKYKHGVELTKEQIGFQHGVHGGNVQALKIFARPGDRVMLHTPAYGSFIRNLKNLGYVMVESPLYLDENNVWRMDFEDMEKKIVSENIQTLLFCSPHNPTGRVWEKWELEKMMEICEKYAVKVVSDEIWSDFVFEGKKHTPLQTVSEYAKYNTIAMYAPSKTFNLAGFNGSYHVCYDKWLQGRLAKEAQLTIYNKMHLLTLHAFQGAYSEEGKEWHKELLQVIETNATYAVNYIKEHFEGVNVSMSDGTYVIFVDNKEWMEKHGKTQDELYNRALEYGVGWQDGRGFGGMTHQRINLAQPTWRVKEAMDRLDKYVFNAQW